MIVAFQEATFSQLLEFDRDFPLAMRWIAEERPVWEVLPDLGAANFDPELFPQHERELIALWNRRHPERPLRLRRKRGLRGLRALLGATRLPGGRGAA